MVINGSIFNIFLFDLENSSKTKSIKNDFICRSDRTWYGAGRYRKLDDFQNICPRKLILDQKKWIWKSRRISELLYPVSGMTKKEGQNHYTLVCTLCKLVNTTIVQQCLSSNYCKLLQMDCKLNVFIGKPRIEYSIFLIVL